MTDPEGQEQAALPVETPSAAPLDVNEAENYRQAFGTPHPIHEEVEAE